MVVDIQCLEKEFLQLQKGQLYRQKYSTGFDVLDPHINLVKGYLMIVSGYPASGKSEWLDAVLINASLMYKWKTLYFSPENYPIQEHMAKLAEKFIGKNVKGFNCTEIDSSIGFLSRHFGWIDKEFPSLKEIVSIAKQRKEERGLDCLVVDPWNGVNHQRNGLRDDEYLMEVLSQLIAFSRRHNILTAIVAHPRSPQKSKDGQIPTPTLSDVAGGAMWGNKADLAVICHRPDFSRNRIEIHVQKIKQKWIGRVGMQELDYDLSSGRFKNIYEQKYLLPTDIPAPF